jgi:hypothetical protein
MSGESAGDTLGNLGAAHPTGRQSIIADRDLVAAVGDVNPGSRNAEARR